jgi:hypothetical protein
MSVGCLVLVFTSIVDTVPLAALVTKAVLPSGVTATRSGMEPTVMSVERLVLVFTSIVDTVPLGALVTKAVARHPLRAGTPDTPPGTISAPANPSTTTPRAHRKHRIAAPASLSSVAPATTTAYVAPGLCELHQTSATQEHGMRTDQTRPHAAQTAATEVVAMLTAESHITAASGTVLHAP